MYSGCGLFVGAGVAKVEDCGHYGHRDKEYGCCFCDDVKNAADLGLVVLGLAVLGLAVLVRSRVVLAALGLAVLGDSPADGLVHLLACGLVWQIGKSVLCLHFGKKLLVALAALCPLYYLCLLLRSGLSSDEFFQYVFVYLHCPFVLSKYT